MFDDHPQSAVTGYTRSFIAAVHARRQAQKPQEREERDRKTAIEFLVGRRTPKRIIAILENVASQYDVSLHSMLMTRLRTAVHARDEAVYLIRTEEGRTPPSLPQIANWIGKDHSSLIVGLARHSERTGAPLVTTANLASRRARARSCYVTARERG